MPNICILQWLFPILRNYKRERSVCKLFHLRSKVHLRRGVFYVRCTICQIYIFYDGCFLFLHDFLVISWLFKLIFFYFFSFSIWIIQ